MITEFVTIIKVFLNKPFDFTMKNLGRHEISHIVEMAWQDLITFDDIRVQYGLTNNEVIKLMRRELKDSSFRMWRKRTAGRITKHKKKINRDEN